MPQQLMASDPGGAPPPPLTARQQAILKLIVHEYVQTRPRRSAPRALTERYAIGVSPATIRNEMAELEAAGYVQHLHTSGGRVPTDRGYRYFVHHLMGDVELPSGDQIMIRHQFRQVEIQLEEWMELAATVLAEIAGNVSVVTAPRTAVAAPAPLRADLAAAAAGVADPGHAREHGAPGDDPLAGGRRPGRAQPLADALVAELRGLVRRRDRGPRGWLDATGPRRRSSRSRRRCATLDAADQTAIRHSGLENIVGQPEFSDADAQGVLDAAARRRRS